MHQYLFGAAGILFPGVHGHVFAADAVPQSIYVQASDVHIHMACSGSDAEPHRRLSGGIRLRVRYPVLHQLCEYDLFDSRVNADVHGDSCRDNLSRRDSAQGCEKV